MPRSLGLSQWQQVVSTQLPHLSRPQATVLALWSLGIVLAQSCGLSSVAVLLGALLDRSETALREQLRDWYRDSTHKRGANQGVKRRSLVVSSCFAPLLRWVLSLHPRDCRQLALAMDASTLGQRFTVLTICVVVRGCAVPIAWHILEATRPGAWRPHWQRLFQQLHGVVPPEWTVLVAGDRGLWAKWLFGQITALGWHPFLRINRQGQYRPKGQASFRPLSQVVRKGGPGWRGQVTCFKTAERQVDCTLLARWDAGYRDPWLVLTDLPPEHADVAWYSLRAWVEAGYKDAKRGGWHWEQTKMRDPRRAERLWLAMAVASLWVVSVGCAAEATEAVPLLDELPPTHVARRRASGKRPPRSLSCFRRGRLLLVVALIRGPELPPMLLLPEPWPESLDTHIARSAAYRPLQKAA